MEDNIKTRIIKQHLDSFIDGDIPALPAMDASIQKKKVRIKVTEEQLQKVIEHKMEKLLNKKIDEGYELI